LKTIRYKVHEKLEKILASDDYIEDGGMVISSLAYQNKDLVVTFSLYPDSNREIKQIWELKIINIAAENFSRNWTTYFSLYSDHFLLYELTDAHVDLYYNGKAKSPEKLLLDLYRSHLKTYPEDFSFTYGINPAMDILNCVKMDQGCLRVVRSVF